MPRTMTPDEGDTWYGARGLTQSAFYDTHHLRQKALQSLETEQEAKPTRFTR